MGVQDLQIFMESKPGGAVNVDLLRIAGNLPLKNNRNNRNRNQPLKLVVDAECCLDRLYGGYFSDWSCGGQWNRTIQFLSLLMRTVERGNMELAIVFNGAFEHQRMEEWKAQQAQIRERVNKVLKHINGKGTPPPKIWWTAPVCLRTVLRMVFRHLNITVLSTMDDHHQEVIGYCREHNFHGLLADDAEYAVFSPPRYFSSKHLKLTYKVSLETKEYMVNELNKALDLTREQLCIVAALLGNNLLPEEELTDIHKNIVGGGNLTDKEAVIKTLAEFVKKLPDITNLDAVTTAILGTDKDDRTPQLKQSIQYYLNGTKDGFLRYRSNSRRNNNKKNNKKQPPVATTPVAATEEVSPIVATVEEEIKEEVELDTSGFASETTEREQQSLEDYKMATANAVEMTPEIIIEQPSSELESTSSSKLTSGLGSTDQEYDSSAPSSDNSRLNGEVNGKSNIQISSSSSSSSSITSPTKQPKKKVTVIEPEFKLPHVAPDVLRTASERHQKGLMNPHIWQILTTGEVRLPCLLEDEQHREIASIYSLYKPIRQNVYAILFNLHHLQYVSRTKQNEKVPEVWVKEWVWSKSNNYEKPSLVKAEPLGWGVPTIHRLWFGAAVDDKRRRLRALLTCLRSDTPLMLNTAYVPQHLLVMACVLRYIMSIPGQRILRRQELDAFITQAFAPELMDPQYLQDLTLPLVTSRGVQLSTLFMQGVETALFANDACGAPIPLLMCCPWLFFDGKLFHHKLARAAVAKSLLELCDNHIDHVVKVDRMKKAIIDGLDVQWARPLIMPPVPGQNVLRQGYPPPNCLPAMNLPSARTGRGLGRRPVPSRGGQLEVAGIVVANWGANYGRQRPNVPRQQPQVTSVGFGAGGGAGNRRQGHGFQGNFPTHPTRPLALNNVNRYKKNTKKKNQNKLKTKVQTREVTVETSSGTITATELLDKMAKKETTSCSSIAAITNEMENIQIQRPTAVAVAGNGGVGMDDVPKSPPNIEQGQGDASAALETTAH